MAYRATIAAAALLISVVSASAKEVTMNTTVSPASGLSGIKCSDIENTNIAKDCLQQGHAGGSPGFMKCVCSELGIEEGCPSGCSSQSRSHQEPPSISLNSVQTESRHIDGEPEVPKMVVVPPTKRHAHDVAGLGKGNIDIGDLSAPPANYKKPSQQRRRRKKSHQESSPETGHGGMSTPRKIIGAIAVGVLVMVV